MLLFPSCRQIVAFVLFNAVGNVFSYAQINTSSLTGLVRDTSGADIAHAHIVIGNKATGLTRQSETDGSGYYNFLRCPLACIPSRSSSLALQKPLKTCS